MRPSNLKTRIFLDSGDPKETREALEIMGYLDGQTTNPTLISKNPVVKAQIQKGQKFSEGEIYEFYKEIVTEVSSLIPEGSVSIEVFADKHTSSEQILAQGMKMFSWIPNAHIKYPVTTEGLKAANHSILNGMRVNMTLVFSQEQGAAVYAATKSAKKGAVFLSPFIGRLDDIGQNGVDLIKNTQKMYGKSDRHVEILTASIRSYEHLMATLAIGSDIVTAPLGIYKIWAEKGMPVPGANYIYQPSGLKVIEYEEIDLSKEWQGYNINHELTDKGIERFVSDWNALIQ